MKTIKGFLQYIEIKTKITTGLSCTFALAYLVYAGRPIRWGLTFLFFAALLLIDFMATAINNYIDSKTNGQILPFQRGTALFIIFVLLFVGSGLGLFLVWRTDLVVLLLGALCVLCGVLYTCGPAPISRQPYGEAVSGVFHGFIGPFLLLYINMPQGTYVTLSVTHSELSGSLMIVPLMTVVLLTVTPVCLVANVMLANNICDLEKDAENKRYTLPYYIGEKALALFAGLYYATYASDVLLVLFGILHPTFLLAFATLWPVQKNINKFFRKQDKEETFIVSIWNFLLIIGVNTGLLLAGAVL